MLSQLVSAATSLRTSPPPAIAAALAAQSRDDLQRCGRVTSQLRQVVKELQECGEGWGRLAASSLDADPATLAQLAVLQQAMVSLARSHSFPLKQCLLNLISRVCLVNVDKSQCCESVKILGDLISRVKIIK